MSLLLSAFQTEGVFDIQKYQEISVSVGHTPRPPVILTNVSVAETREESQNRAMEFLGAKWDSIDSHYNFSDGHLGKVKGYELNKISNNALNCYNKYFERNMLMNKAEKSFNKLINK